jgi:trimeric autotransporter adhesin
MSTKTNFKRVALVAVTTLGLGVLTSVAPANAVPGALTVSASSLGVCASDSAAGLTTIAMSKSGSLIITAAATPASTDTVKATGVLNFTGKGNNTGTISVDQKKFTYNNTTAGDFTLTPSGVGAATIYTQTGGTGANVQTVNVTVVDSCTGSAVANAANSYIQVIDTSGRYQTAANLGTSTKSTYSNFASNLGDEFLDTSVDQATSFANAATAYVNVTARDAYKLPLAGTSYYYGIACTGDVVVNGGSTNGGFVAGASGQYSAQFSVAQGTLNAGVATTCTVTVNNVVLGTKSITIKGDLAKIEASLRTSGESGTAAGAATAGTISYKYFDSAGNRLGTSDSGLGDPSLTATGSALINAISSVTATTKDTTGRLSFGCVGATKSGDVSLVIKRTNAAGATISAPAFTASCGGALDTYTASLDKATYQTGDIATLTIKGLDANGKAVNDAVTAGASAAIAVTGMTPVTTPATTDAFSGGTLVYTYKVDNEPGNYVASVYLPSAGTQTAAVVSKATITAQAGGVSNADVLKAIVSLIASINKQIAALQKALLRR